MPHGQQCDGGHGHDRGEADRHANQARLPLGRPLAHARPTQSYTHASRPPPYGGDIHIGGEKVKSPLEQIPFRRNRLNGEDLL